MVPYFHTWGGGGKLPYNCIAKVLQPLFAFYRVVQSLDYRSNLNRTLLNLESLLLNFECPKKNQKHLTTQDIHPKFILSKFVDLFRG
jgi:hypothetical protein